MTITSAPITANGLGPLWMASTNQDLALVKMRNDHPNLTRALSTGTKEKSTGRRQTGTHSTSWVWRKRGTSGGETQN